MSRPNHSISAELLDEFIHDYLNNRNLSVVRQANATLPIVWFGDSRAYYASRQKIVTIGLNPSWKEFSEPRFDMSIDFQKTDAKHRLSMTLDQYFEDNPYWSWFRRFETVLNLLNASYKKDSFKNRALHIDIHSSIATNPTWGNSQFRESDRNKLRRPDLFRKLLTELSPDILLFSVNETIRKEIFGDFEEVDSKQYEKADGKPVRGVYLRLYRRGRMQLLSGRNMQGTPFGGMSNTWLRQTIPTLQWMPATTVCKDTRSSERFLQPKPNNNPTNTMNNDPIQPSDFNQPTSIIRLTGKEVEAILDKPFELYERTRSAWRASSNGKIAKTTLALVAYRGIVREAYTIAGWFRSNEIMRLGLKTSRPDRYAFVGNFASAAVRAKFVGRSVKGLFKKAAVGPVVTFGTGRI